MIPPWLQRTSSTFPYQVERVADLPESLVPPASAALPNGTTPDFIFVAPANVYLKGLFGMRLVPEQALLFTQDGVLHVQAAATARSAPAATYYRANGLLYLQSGLPLLYGRIELAGLVDGTLARAVVEYNTVGWKLVQPSIQRLTRLATGDDWTSARPEANPAHVETMVRSLPYKFANGVRIYAVQKGEVLQGVAFQPDIWIRHLGIFRRQLTPPTALALTDHCVVLVEEESAMSRKSAAYGWVFTYIPRTAVIEMQITPRETRQELNISMQRRPATAARRLILENGPANAWRSLWATYAGPGGRRPHGVEV